MPYLRVSVSLSDSLPDAQIGRLGGSDHPQIGHLGGQTPSDRASEPLRHPR